MTFIAKGRLGNHDIEAECINPGDWFGKTSGRQGLDSASFGLLQGLFQLPSG